MPIYSDYDIADPPEPPGWLQLFPPLQNQWMNPVSQRLFPRVRKGPLPASLVTLLIGLAISLTVNIVLRREEFGESRWYAGAVVTVAIPISAAIFIAFIRITLASLVGNVVFIRRLFERGTVAQWLTVPLSDTDLFNGIRFRSVISGLRSIEHIYALAIGVIVPFVLLNGFLPSEDFISDFGILYGYILILWALAGPLVYLYLLAGAAALYSINLPVAIAATASVAHTAFAFLFAWLIRLVAVSSILPDMDVGNPMRIILELLTIAILYGLAVLTSRIGVMVFARYRRPGFYEPEWASAAGMRG
jgi:hypothetical protein